MYGVAVTPALFAALTWKRATAPGRRGVDRRRRGGDGVLRVRPAAAGAGHSSKGRRAGATTSATDPWGIPSIYPAALHLDRPARRGQPDDAAAAAGGTREAVPGERGRRAVARSVDPSA
ncbi:MAG: hypothetical protein M0C28_16315 [Candidatus Moduliflexus flocculans]|nr:hypothetical protein [Candidatus Moduliflexus flocculans]